MWSREGLRAQQSMYNSTPHLFVYQPSSDYDEDDEEDCYEHGSSVSGSNNTEPSDSGYADSSIMSTQQNDVIYCNTREKDAVRRLSQKFNKQQEITSESSSSCSGSDVAVSAPETTQTPTTTADQLTELELLRVETFFRGNRTQVFVGKSLANLYLREAKSLVGLNRASSQPDVCSRTLQRQSDRVTDWQLKFTGIPVILLDGGSNRSRHQRRIQLVLAERGTGFTLWRDVIDNLSNYEAAGPTFHTMRTSSDHRQIAGLSFDSCEAAQQLFRHVESLCSDPANIRLSAPKTASRTSSFLRRLLGSSKKSPPVAPPPRKSDISQPCFFQHVTSVESTDRLKFFSFQALVSHQP